MYQLEIDIQKVWSLKFLVEMDRRFEGLIYFEDSCKCLKVGVLPTFIAPWGLS